MPGRVVWSKLRRAWMRSGGCWKNEDGRRGRREGSRSGRASVRRLRTRRVVEVVGTGGPREGEGMQRGADSGGG